MPKVSVIIPIYGVEKYIERCARSLFEQTLDDIEFIFVNDCTKDSSMHILDNVINEYPNRLHQIKIINHDVNKGLPKARMTGVKVATGEYIAHCDSDDWVDLDLYEKVYEIGCQENADVVISDVDTTNGYTHKYESGGSLFDVNDCIIAFMHRRMWWSVWHIFYKRSIYNHIINTPIDSMGEDMCFTLQYIYNCKKIAYLHHSYYHYFLSPDSIVRSQNEETCLSKYLQICRNVEKVKKFYSGKPQSDGIKKGLRFLEYNAKFPLFPLLGFNKYYKLWCNCYKGCEWSVIWDRYAPFKERIRALLIYLGIFPYPRNKYSNQ